MKSKILFHSGVKTWSAIEPIEDLPEYVKVEFYCEPLPGGLENPIYEATVRIPAEHRKEETHREKG